MNWPYMSLVLDYSDELLDPLDEAALFEISGTGAAPGSQVVTGPGEPRSVSVQPNGAVDWDGDGALDGEGLRLDITYMLPGASSYCPPSPDELLAGHDDWDAIRLRFWDLCGSFGRVGRLSALSEPQREDVVGLSPDDDGDGTPDVLDCAPASVGPPEAVQELRVHRASPALLSWSGSPGLPIYFDVVGGSLGELRRVGWGPAPDCMATGITGLSWSLPAMPGQEDRYYLVRAVNPCGTGAVGFASDDSRLPDPPPCR